MRFGRNMSQYLHSMQTKPQWHEESDVALDEEIDIGRPAQIVVYDDDFNTFDHVILCFVKILGHTPFQSEQLALLIHNTGKAAVKGGTHQILSPLKDALVERGLSAVIEEI
jgi:ATP-dependent Clp protease adaptor protein ClpS